MGVRRVLLWPVYRVAGWADDNPLSAVGVLVACGALLAFASSVAGVDAGGREFVYGGVAAGAVVETAAERPAFVVLALVGTAVFLLYDG